jgi:hypothetical protein
MARSTVWVYNPHRGGKSIPPLVRRQLEDRLRAHGQPFLDPLGYRLEVRFHGCFCYLDAADEQQGRDPARAWGEPLQLCRLRYSGDADRVSFAFHSYSSERYEPAVFPSGEWTGTPEEAFDVCAGTYLGASGRGIF